MAGGIDLGAGSSKGRKPLDAVINLVPFIDLMAVTISFLLLTAVWTQTGRLQVSISQPSTTAAAMAPSDRALSLFITAQKLKLMQEDTVLSELTTSRDAMGRLEVNQLKQQLSALQKRMASLPGLTLHVEDGIRYDDLVRVVDICNESGLENVSFVLTDADV